jgi:hypothetical protein
MSHQAFVVRALFSPGAHLGSVLKLCMGYYTVPTIKHDWSVQTKMNKQKKPAIELKDGSKLRCYNDKRRQRPQSDDPPPPSI